MVYLSVNYRIMRPMSERWPQPGDQLPLWGGAIVRLIGKTGLGLFGWRFVGQLPNFRQYVITVAPHTSNWDWVIAMLTIMALGVRVSWLGKGRLFRGPFKWFFTALNGLPVNRDAPGDLVEQITERFASGEPLILGLAPEGTRSEVNRFRSGYYRIARAAGIPVVPAYLNYPDKIIGVGPLLEPLEQQAADIDRLQAFYDQRSKRIR